MIDIGTITRDHLVSGKYYKAIYHMDIEVFPKWWSIVFRHKGKKHSKFTSHEANLEGIRKITSRAIITAYNAKRYDLKIIYAILAGLEPELIYEISDAIINNNGESDNPLIRKFLRSVYWAEFDFIDLMDDMDKSLKEHESNMGIEIIESSISWDKEDLTEEDEKELLFYNHHDVVAQEKFFLKRLNSYFLPKLVLAEMFDLHPINTMKNTNANVTAAIFGAKKLPADMLKDRPYELPNRIADYITKYVPEKFIETFLTTGMDVVNKKEMSFKDFGNKGKFGKGGLHSIMREYIRVESNDKFKLFLIDVSSYYPNLQIHFDILSRAVEDKSKLPEIYDRRSFEKSIGHKIFEKALKLVLVTVFGASGQRFNKLYDPNMAWSVTITGQLLLYALSKELWIDAGCKIVQTNTDGTLVGVKNEDIPKMREIVTAWEDMTGLKMEYDEIDVIAQRDVNNYACKFTNGNTKVKGGLCMQAITCDETAFEVVTYQNWDMRITHEAVFRYLIFGDKIEDTIRKCTDLMMFISTTKTGGTYQYTYKYIDGKEIEIQKTNRVIATNNVRYGTLKKFKITKGKKPRSIPKHDWERLIDKLESLIDEYSLNVKYREDAKEKIKLINKELMNLDYDEKILKAICLREQYDKVPKISEHSFIMNKDMNEYDWNTWKDRIDYDFYIHVAEEKVKGWAKA